MTIEDFKLYGDLEELEIIGSSENMDKIGGMGDIL